MKKNNLPKLVGVVHLPPLPGSPGAGSAPANHVLQAAGFQAVQEAKVLEQAGFDGVILENFGDAPFFKEAAPAETVAAMSVIATAVGEVVKIPVGVNVLRNDGISALKIASVTGSAFIRVNVLTGVYATDQGIIEGCAAELLRERKRLGSEVRILADVHVKHAKCLSSDILEVAIEETIGRGGADGIILTGSTTGRLLDFDAVAPGIEHAKKLGVPVFLGSGAKRSELSTIRNYFDHIIVGSDLKKGGVATNALDKKRAREFVLEFKKSGKNRISLAGSKKRKTKPKQKKKSKKKAKKRR